MTQVFDFDELITQLALRGFNVNSGAYFFPKTALPRGESILM